MIKFLGFKRKYEGINELNWKVNFNVSGSSSGSALLFGSAVAINKNNL